MIPDANTDLRASRAAAGERRSRAISLKDPSLSPDTSPSGFMQKTSLLSILGALAATPLALAQFYNDYDLEPHGYFSKDAKDPTTLLMKRVQRGEVIINEKPGKPLLERFLCSPPPRLPSPCPHASGRPASRRHVRHLHRARHDRPRPRQDPRVDAAAQGAPLVGARLRH